MVLHTINKSSAWIKCNGLINESDIVVLIEDGVYLGLDRLIELNMNNTFALQADTVARGIVEKLPQSIRQISYARFVNLTVTADKVCAWF